MTIPPLFEHQQKIINDDPKWCGIFHGTGGAKTRTSLELAKGLTLIVVPKQQREDKTFEMNAHRFGIDTYIRVMSKEDFRRDWKTLPPYDTLIIDECHNMLGVLPDTKTVKGASVPRTSQLFEALSDYTLKYPPKRFYLLSATPAPKPMSVWALGTLLGREWNYFDFREKYYIQRKIGFRSIWLPRNTSELKQRLADLIRSLGYVGKLEDWFDVPEQTFKTVHCELTIQQKVALKQLEKTEADPMAKRARQRTIENGILYDTEIQSKGRIDKMVKVTKQFDSQKIDYIIERAEEFPKMLIFANYIGQINQIAIELRGKGYKVLTLTGETKNRATVISEAEEGDACIVIAQSGISAGYELKSFNVVIFASKSYRYLDYIQGIGRVLRADALKKNLYINLVIKGGMDEACHKAIESGMDFQERITA